MSIALDSVTAIQLVHAMNCLLEAIQVTTGYSLQANLLSKSTVTLTGSVGVVTPACGHACAAFLNMSDPTHSCPSNWTVSSIAPWTPNMF